MPGLAQAIVKASSELAGAGVRDAEALPRGPLERTWRRYRQRLAALGMRDPEERLAVACSAIETGRVAAPSLAIVESVTDMRLLRALAARVERLIVVVELCGTPEAPAEADAVWVPLLSWARQAGAKPLRMGEPRAVDVRVTAFADRRAEVDGIATAIRDAGLLARDVVVAFTAIDDYAPLVRERFRGFGIPFEVARGLPLETAPVVRSAMALCEAVLAGFSRVAVERALASPHVRFGGLSYLRVDRLAREALVVGGGGARAVKSEWIEPLRRLEAPTEKASQFAETHIALLERALAMLAQLELPRSPREAARMLMGIWRRFGLGRRKTRERELSLLAKEAAAWERLLALTEETARGLWLGGVERVELRELVAALRAAIADERYDAPDAVRGERVRVVALRDVLGLRCTRVFVGGLDEATFPGAPPSALLLDSTRRKQLGLPLHAEEVALAKQRLCAAMAMAPAELSFPRGELAARDAAATMLLGLSASVGDGGSLGAPYTEERRQRLLARGDAPELAALSRASPAALAQALGAERSRERMELGGWDGILAAQVSPGLRAAVVRDLEARLLTSASVTQLDSYAGCPFRFFASRALGLLPLHDPLEVDTALAGRLVHAVLCDFYRNLRDARLLGRPEADWKAVARPQMQAALERQIDRLSPTRRDAFFAELVRYLGAGLHGNGVAGLLEAFLTCEAEALAEHEPVAFELPFGETPHAGPDGERRLPELVVEVPAQAPVRIAGVIDRVDRLRSTGGAVVFDYKTGRLLPRRSQLAEGYRFQLAVYLAAIASEMTPAAGGYYRLNDAAEITRDRFVDAEVASRVPAAVAHLAQWVRAGRFAPGHLPPRDKGCHFCDHKVICRVDHDRLHALALRRAAGVFIPLRLAREPQGRPSDSGLRGES
jgi:ATP-dependent helicase/nuclease subunit B